MGEWGMMSCNKIEFLLFFITKNCQAFSQILQSDIYTLKLFQSASNLKRILELFRIKFERYCSTYKATGKCFG